MTRYTYITDEAPKMLRETLCLAQHALTLGEPAAAAGPHVRRLQHLIDACDELRPLGADGKHDQRHTPYCGCEDVGPR